MFDEALLRPPSSFVITLTLRSIHPWGWANTRLLFSVLQTPITNAIQYLRNLFSELPSGGNTPVTAALLIYVAAQPARDLIHTVAAADSHATPTG